MIGVTPAPILTPLIITLQWVPDFGNSMGVNPEVTHSKPLNIHFTMGDRLREFDGGNSRSLAPILNAVSEFDVDEYLTALQEKFIFQFVEYDACDLQK